MGLFPTVALKHMAKEFSGTGLGQGMDGARVLEAVPSMLSVLLKLFLRVLAC